MKLDISQWESKVMNESVAEFGVYHQCLIAAEEFIELAHALLKINRLDIEIDMQEHINTILDEIADTKVVLGQILRIFDPNQIVTQQFTDFKMVRLENRIVESQRIRDTLEKIDPDGSHIDNKPNLDKMILRQVKEFWSNNENLLIDPK